MEVAMSKKKRKSAKVKTEAVLELLRGKTLEEVSRKYVVSIAELSKWRNAFIRNGERAFKRDPESARISEYEKVIGRIQMELELYKKKERFRNQQ